jgi:membrane fusion protein, multidrug efflux system
MNDVHRSLELPGSLDTMRPASRTLFTRRHLLILAGVVAALVAAAWLLTPKATPAPKGRSRSGGGTASVAAARARAGEMSIVVNGLGTVTPLATVTVQSQISGQITQISFKEGQMIKRGDSLIQIDPRPYKVALEQAQGALARDLALLENARIDLKRYDMLFQQDSIAQQQLATQRSLVAQHEGTAQTDRAQIDAARLNLSYCHIVSPVDGRAGLQQVNLGNYVTPAAPNGLVVVTQIKPIAVVFPLPEDQIQPILEQLHAGRTLTVTAYDRSHSTRLAVGTMSTIDSQIDTTTGTVKLKALFPNSDERLFPNQFVNVDLLLDTLHGATLIPEAGIQRGVPGTYVYVVNEDKTVSVRKVTLGPADAHNVVITSGLSPGELVVVDGADRLREGAKVALRQSGSESEGTSDPHAGGKHGHGKGGGHRKAAGSSDGGQSSS